MPASAEVSALVSGVVGSVLAGVPRRGVAVGCAVGGDALVVSAALALGASSRLRVSDGYARENHLGETVGWRRTVPMNLIDSGNTVVADYYLYEGRKPRIFINSLMTGYTSLRVASSRAIERAGCKFVLAENYPAGTVSPLTACLDGAAICDGTVLILGARYSEPAVS